MSIQVSGSCIDEYLALQVPDSGSHTIPAGAIVAYTGQEDERCAVEVVVSRLREGVLDPAYDGGEAVGRQRRTASATSAP